jgi:hypothetical protein
MEARGVEPLYLLREIRSATEAEVAQGSMKILDDELRAIQAGSRLEAECRPCGGFSALPCFVRRRRTSGGAFARVRDAPGRVAR